MKQLAVVLAFTGIAWSQSEPDAPEVFFRLDGTKLVALERQNPPFKIKARGFIVVASSMSAQLKGGKSPIRVAAGQVDLVIRTAATDPQSIFVLRRLDAKKDSRQIVVSRGHVTPVGATFDSNNSGSSMPVEFARYGQGSVKASAKLPAGEYAIGRPMGPALFCFGVD
jgi:hypothetical protein